MEVVVATSQRAGKHYPLLEQFLPQQTVGHLKDKFPTEQAVDTLFRDGATIMCNGTPYLVQLEWRQMSTDRITALYLRCYSNLQLHFLTLAEFQPGRDLTYYEWSSTIRQNGSIYSEPTKMQLVSLDHSFEIPPFSQLLEKGTRSDTSEVPPQQRGYIEKGKEMQREAFPFLSSVELIVNSSSSSSSANSELQTKTEREEASSKMSEPVQPSMTKSGSSSSSPNPELEAEIEKAVEKMRLESKRKCSRRLVALAFTGMVLAILGLYGALRWAFNHLWKAKTTP